MANRVPRINAFETFVSEAAKLTNQRSAASSADDRLIQRFAAFVDEAGPLSVRLQKRSPNLDFQRFVEEARPVIVKHIKHLLPRIRARAKLAKHWFETHDLLRIAGFGAAEDPYTELMAWALAPATHPPSAWARQRAWLSHLGLLDRVKSDAACEPQTQVYFDDGRPDLVMAFDGFELVVEAKTGTAEHQAPSGRMQTIAYERSEKTAVVLIAPDRREAANESALATTFAEFVFCIAETVEPIDLPLDLRIAYRMLFKHVLSYATLEVDPKILLTRINSLNFDDDVDDLILRHMSDFQHTITLLGLETANGR